MKSRIVLHRVSLLFLCFLAICVVMFHDISIKKRNFDVSGGLVLTSYFTTQPDPQRNIPTDNNNFDYIKPLYESAIQHEIPVVIFHDGLSVEFIDKYSNYLIKFEKVNLRDSISMNDERFLFYQEYIRREEIEKQYSYIMLTDVSDVIFLRNPFEFDLQSMDDCKIWVLRENVRMAEIYPVLKDCYSHKSSFVNINFSKDDMIFNAGVIGGKVDQVLFLIDELVRELARMDRGKNNCNMPALQYILPRMYQSSQICSKNMCWKDKECDANPFVHHKP